MREPTADVREPQGFAVRASRAVRAYGAQHGRSHLVATAAGVFMALVNAFGMEGAGLATRLVYWITLINLGAILGAAAGPAIARQPRIGDNPVALWAAITTAISIPATVVVWLVTSLMFHRPLAPALLPYFVGAVLPVSAAMTAIMMQVNRPGAATHAAPAGTAPVRFAQRLTGKIMGGAIWAVSAEDHYLRIHTSKGADLILMRLADAIAELEGVEGAQVHRSWWIARDGIAEVRRDGARVTLVLKNGAAAPVSRPNVKALKDAGWF